MKKEERDSELIKQATLRIRPQRAGREYLDRERKRKRKKHREDIYIYRERESERERERENLKKQ